jgi:hypothetical protein
MKVDSTSNDKVIRGIGKIVRLAYRKARPHANIEVEALREGWQDHKCAD